MFNAGTARGVFVLCIKSYISSFYHIYKEDIQMDIKENLAKSMKAIMKKRKKTLDEFADFLGISRSMLQVYLMA